MTAEKQIETSQILSVIWSLTYREVRKSYSGGNGATLPILWLRGEAVTSSRTGIYMTMNHPSSHQCYLRLEWTGLKNSCRWFLETTSTLGTNYQYIWRDQSSHASGQSFTTECIWTGTQELDDVVVTSRTAKVTSKASEALIVFLWTYYPLPRLHCTAMTTHPSASHTSDKLMTKLTWRGHKFRFVFRPIFSPIKEPYYPPPLLS